MTKVEPEVSKTFGWHARVGRFLFLRLTGLSFFFAYLSLVMHVEFYFSCLGVLNIPLQEYGAQHILILSTYIALLLSAFLVLYTEESLGYYETTFIRFLFTYITLIYALITQLGEGGIFSRDYDLLLLECGFLALCLVSPEPRKYQFTRQCFTYVLFRFTFTYAANLLYSNCISTWDLSYFVHSYKLPEPMTVNFLQAFRGCTLLCETGVSIFERERLCLSEGGVSPSFRGGRVSMFQRRSWIFERERLLDRQPGSFRGAPRTQRGEPKTLT